MCQQVESLTLESVKRKKHGQPLFSTGNGRNGQAVA